MSSLKHNRALFQLEFLESRTLLAGVDPSAALTSSATYLLDFTSTASDSAVTIAGTRGGDLSINASLLPSSIKDLHITGFDHVTILGSEQLNSLELGHVGTFTGADVDVQTLTATSVGSLSMHSVKVFATLAGTEMRLELFDARSATIYSTLDRLTVASSNDAFLINLISVNPSQEIRLDFRTANLPLGPTQKVVLPGGTPDPSPSGSLGGSDVTRPSGTEDALPGATQDTLPSGTQNVLPGEIQVILPNDIPPNTVNTFNGNTYTVVVLSLSNAKDVQLLKLQDALRQGDLESVRTFIAGYLKSNATPSEGALNVSLPATRPTELYLAEFGRVLHIAEHETNLVDHHVVTGPMSQIGDASSAKLRLFDGQETLRSLALRTPLSSDTPSKEASAVSNAEPVMIVTESADDMRLTNNAQTLAPSEPAMLDRVRSMLSNLATGVDSRTSTVSTYIIGRLGNQLQPGVRPGLLVDAKPARAGGSRESMWIQV